MLRDKRSVRYAAGSFAVIVCIGVAVVGFADGPNDRPNGPISGQNKLVVSETPFKATLDVTGSIAPDETVQVVAPFDGPVTSMDFSYGDEVKKGQVLTVLGTEDLAEQQLATKSEYLKALQEAKALRHWKTSVDVARAQRSLKTAQAELDDAQRKLKESKKLLDEGLIPRNEYESTAQQVRSQEASVAGARDELDATLKRGDEAHKQVAELDLKAAKSKFDDVTRRLDEAALMAPVAGVILRPPVDQSSDQSAIYNGARLVRGQLIGLIAQPDKRAVELKVDEVDAANIEPGQPAEITGPGLVGVTIPGHVVSVASEANATNIGEPATFSVRVAMDNLSPKEMKVARIGMSAHVSIQLYQDRKALVLPAEAIEGGSPNATVKVTDGASGKVRTIPVVLGHVSPEGVQIVSGLKPGDTVVW